MAKNIRLYSERSNKKTKISKKNVKICLYRRQRVEEERRAHHYSEITELAHKRNLSVKTKKNLSLAQINHIKIQSSVVENQKSRQQSTRTNKSVNVSLCRLRTRAEK